MEKIWREPLVQFLVLGAILFGVFRVIGQWNIEKPAEIVVTQERIDSLNKGFALDFKREPTPEDTEKLIQDYIREEVFVREAAKINLHLENQNVRIQLRRLMEDEYSSAPVPTDEDLESFLQQNPDRFRTSPDQPVPPLSQIKTAVRNAWQANRRKEGIDTAYQNFLKNYHVVIRKSKSPATTTAIQ